jgi:hypothetical protein
VELQKQQQQQQQQQPCCQKNDANALVCGQSTSCLLVRQDLQGCSYLC